MTITNRSGAGSAVPAPAAAPLFAAGSDSRPQAGPGAPIRATPSRAGRASSYRGRLAACLALVALLLAAVPAAHAQVDVERLAELVRAGDYEAAYELAHEHVGEMAGNVEFDFYYGIAAVDTGNLSEGIFALERVLIAQPGADRARLELARAYFLRGDDRRARQEFEAVEAHDPPAPVQAQIERYQLAMQRRAGRYESSVSGYIEFGAGYDSNVNSATDAESVEILGGLAEVALSDDSRERSDGFGRFEARVRGSQPVQPGVNVVAEGGYRGRNHADETQFNTGNLDASIGAVLRRPEWQLRGTLNFGRFYLDGETYRNSLGASGVYQRNLGQRTIGTASIEFADLTYDIRPALDSRIGVLGVGMSHTFPTKRRPTVSGQVYAGAEQADSDSAQSQAEAERELAGIKGAVRMRLAPEWTFDGGAEIRASEYGEANPFLSSEPRDETYYSLELALDWRPRARWTFGPRLRHSSNDSNIDLYEYDRTEIQVRARYDFY